MATMDAEGQGLLEVMIMLPLLFMLVILMFRFNMAVQMAINNAQYARSQLYILTGNSPEYPRLAFRHELGGASRMSFFSRGMDMMVLGVADPQAIDEASGDTIPPMPQLQRIGKRDLPGVSSDPGEGHLRSQVNVRETSAICTQMNGVSRNTRYDSDGVLGLKSKRWPFGKLPCQYEGQWIGDVNE
jgi:hypothetical protein